MKTYFVLFLLYLTANTGLLLGNGNVNLDSNLIRLLQQNYPNKVLNAYLSEINKDSSQTRSFFIIWRIDKHECSNSKALLMFENKTDTFQTIYLDFFDSMIKNSNLKIDSSILRYLRLNKFKYLSKNLGTSDIDYIILYNLNAKNEISVIKSSYIDEIENLFNFIISRK